MSNTQGGGWAPQRGRIEQKTEHRWVNKSGASSGGGDDEEKKRPLRLEGQRLGGGWNREIIPSIWSYALKDAAFTVENGNSHKGKKW